MITRGVVAAGVVLVAVASIAGCTAPTPAATDAGATSSPTDGPTSSPTTGGDQAAGAVDFGPDPVASGVPGCGALLPADLVAAVVPSARPVDLLTDAAHLAGSEAFLPAAGGATCDVSNGVAPLDDHVPGRRDEPVFEGVRLTVLPAGADALAEFRGFDGGSTDAACAASDAARVYCSADTLAGSAWVSIHGTRLQDDDQATPEQLQPAFDALVAAVVDRVASSSAGTAPGDGVADDGSITQCDATNVNASTSTQLEVGPFPNSSTAPETTDFARNRVGGDSCAFVSGDDSTGYLRASALYAHLPDGGWMAERRLAAGTIDRGDRLELDGLGTGDAAWRTCDETACSVDVVHDGDWSHWLLFRDVAPDTSAAIERWVRASWTA